MARTASHPTQKRQTKAQIARVFAAAKEAGYPVRVEIHPDGRIVATPCALVDTEHASDEGWGDVK